MNKKRLLSAIISICIALSMVFCLPTDAAAATKGVKVTYNGKSITFYSRYDEESSEPKSLKEVEKKWGKKTRLAKEGEEYADMAYVWKKGKSKISIMQDFTYEGDQIVYADRLGYVCAEVRDKNVTVAGVKVGMKKSTAVKKLQKLYGKKNVTADKGKKGTITVSADAGIMEIRYKNNKISYIFWMRS